MKTNIKTKNLTVTEIVSHRNGIAGNGFYLVRFYANDKPKQELLATVFFSIDSKTDGYCAVISPNDCEACFRGDYFEDELREAISIGTYKFKKEK